MRSIACNQERQASPVTLAVPYEPFLDLFEMSSRQRSSELRRRVLLRNTRSALAGSSAEPSELQDEDIRKLLGIELSAMTQEVKEGDVHTELVTLMETAGVEEPGPKLDSLSESLKGSETVDMLMKEILESCQNRPPSTIRLQTLELNTAMTQCTEDGKQFDVVFQLIGRQDAVQDPVQDIVHPPGPEFVCRLQLSIRKTADDGPWDSTWSSNVSRIDLLGDEAGFFEEAYVEDDKDDSAE